ncbi:MAG TPA: ATP-dependent DNA ligase [Candidatus Binatia bacterium]
MAGRFPALPLAIRPPFAPMEARSAAEIPRGERWTYEPKWDGFRCLVFHAGDVVALQSKSGQPLTRYFPELVEAVTALPERRFVLDGEIVVGVDGRLDFDALLQRIHPAASRVRRLAAETPCSFLAFDLLLEERRDLTSRPLRERRAALERFCGSVPAGSLVQLSPATDDRAVAERWMRDLDTIGLDGVVAKLAGEPYHSGDRDGMVKVKRLRTADCVVGGFRHAQGSRAIGSLLLGLYDDGLLHHVGFAASFTASERAALRKVLEPHVGGSGFSGNAPGGPSRWSTDRSAEWQPLDPVLVCEVRYDHFSGGRFRHGCKFLRWRPEKVPTSCTFAQLGGAMRAKGARSKAASGGSAPPRPATSATRPRRPPAGVSPRRRTAPRPR